MADLINIYFQQAQLSMAAYANFTTQTNDDPKQYLKENGDILRWPRNNEHLD